MVVEMCNDKKLGMTLSSESEVEKRFKKISANIFGLSENEIVDIFECRKSIKIKIPKTGYPIWSLKYLDESAYAGVKNRVVEIIDRYNDFILETGNQADIMEETVAIFKENAKSYQELVKNLLSDKTALLEGITNFIFNNSAKAKEVCDEYGFTFGTLFTMLKSSMEEEIWQWREEAVRDRIDRLVLDLEMVGVVNKAIEGKAESVEKIRTTLENMLELIRIPGSVYVGLGYNWSDAVIAMREISINKWVSYSFEEKKKVIEILKLHMLEAIDNINNPIAVLKKYIAKTGLGTFSADEYESLLKKLHKESYDQTEGNFKEKLRKEIDELAYSKKVSCLKKLWSEAADCDSIKAWSQTWKMPAVWAVPELSSAIATLLSIEANERVDVSRLDNAISMLQSSSLDVLKDKQMLDLRFVENVSSDKNKDLILPHIDDLKGYFTKAYPYTSSWQSHMVDIRKLVEKYVHENLKAEVGDKAKYKVSGYSEQELRKIMEKILENCIDACSIVLDE